VLVNAGMIWLVRVLYHHTSMLSAAADLGLTSLAVVFATWAAYRSGSAWLALWCFFLLQAFFVWLPAGDRRRWAPQLPAEDGAAFERARRAAETALRRLAQSQ
jgi:hypothetical protein